MKTTHGLGSLFFAVTVFAVGLFTSSIARAGELVSVAVTNVFVPVGFDSNDEIVVAVDGYLPDPCHVLRKPEVRVDRQSRIVTVSPMAERVTGVCFDVIVPYQTVITVGTLPAGEFSVRSGGAEKRERLVVKTASSPGPDDYLYAPVDAAHAFRRLDKVVATLRGRLTNTCLDFAEVRVIDSGKTFEVLPILRMTDRDPQGNPCRATERPFEKVVELPELKPGRYLLHVRSMNGQSVNEIFHTYW